MPVSKIKSAFNCIDNNDYIGLQNLFKDGLDSNVFNKNGDTLLTYSIKHDKENFVSLVLENGADANLKSNSVENISFRESGIIKLFLNNHHEIKGLSPLMISLNPSYDVINNSNDDDLNSKTNKKIVSLLIQYGANVNAKESTYGLTPLHFASNCQDYPSSKLLFENGAKANIQAFKNGACEKNLIHKVGFTPATFAVDHDFSYISNKLVNLHSKNNSNFKIYENNLYVFPILVSCLSEQNFKKASSLMYDVVKNDFKKVDRNYVMRKIDAFLQNAKLNEKSVDRFTSSLLGNNSNFNTLLDDMKYFCHLKSWYGYISGDFTSDTKKSSEPIHIQIEGEGWWPIYQINNKIKSLTYILADVKEDRINTQKEFNENKGLIEKKLKDEIFNQVTTFYAVKHLGYILNIKDASVYIPKIDEYLETPKWYLSTKPSLKRTLNAMVINNWCENIGKLKTDESYCLYFGSTDHSTYLEFKKEKDNSISRIIYNCGGASQLHLRDLNGNFYPHVVSGIPQKSFANKSQKALSYLNTIVTAINYPSFDIPIVNDITGNKKMNPAFNAVYSSAQLLSKKPYENIDPMRNIAIKRQVVGNCSLKNKHFRIKNGFGNSLFNYTKQYEENYYVKKLNISPTLYKFKELEKDTQLFNYLKSQGDFKETKFLIEKTLFKFFNKRATHDISNINLKKGDRIATAMSFNQNPESIKIYFQLNPILFELLNSVACHFNSNKLKSLITRYGDMFEFSFNQNLSEDKLRYYVQHQSLNSGKNAQISGFNSRFERAKNNRDVRDEKKGLKKSISVEF